MEFYPGFPISAVTEPMGFHYGEGAYGPEPELRRLDAIRASLLEPRCQGPENVYCIAMDVGLSEDRSDLLARNLLYGAVTYAKGSLGREPVRSQGHIHAVSPSCGVSTCEVYEIWDGEACIYMQESGGDDAGNCYAVTGRPGDVIIVPPDWVHATVNLDPKRSMTFGAWCVRDYGFVYDEVRRHGGIAYFPLLSERDGIVWEPNQSYSSARLTVKPARAYEDFGLRPGVPIYQQYRDDPALFEFVTQPRKFSQLWENYRP